MSPEEIKKAIDVFYNKSRKRVEANIKASQQNKFEATFWRNIVKEIYPNDMGIFYKLLDEQLKQNNLTN